MIVSDILGRVRPVLNDSDASAYRWSDPDLTNYINDACRLIQVHRPDANTETTNLSLVVGAKQTLADTHEKLIDVVCASNGRAVTLIDVSVLDAFNPGWRSSAASDTPKHYMYDPRASREFWLYPPVKTAGTTLVGKVTLKHSVLSGGSSTIGLRDIYMEPIVAFVLFKAYARDMEFAGNADLAGMYLNQFNGMLGLKLTKDVAFAPQQNRRGDSPEPAIQMGGV